MKAEGTSPLGYVLILWGISVFVVGYHQPRRTKAAAAVQLAGAVILMGSGVALILGRRTVGGAPWPEASQSADTDLSKRDPEATRTQPSR